MNLKVQLHGCNLVLVIFHPSWLNQRQHAAGGELKDAYPEGKVIPGRWLKAVNSV